MGEEDYWINYYYAVAMKIMEKTGVSEEEIQEKICNYIEENKVIGNVIGAINKFADNLNIQTEKDIDIENLLARRKNMKNLSDFSSKDELDHYIESKVPHLIHRKLIKKAERCKKNKEFQQAREFYEKAIQINYHDISLLSNLTEILMELGEFEEAEVWIDKLLEEEHNWLEPRSLLQKSYLLLRKNSISKTLDVLKTLFTKYPSYIERVIQDAKFEKIIETDEFKALLSSKQEFEVNEYIKVVLDIGGISIHVGGKPLRRCTQLVLINPYNEEYFHSIEDLPPQYERLSIDEEFWGHCSCLQAWA